MEKKNYSINSELTKLRSAIDTKNTLDKLLCNVNLHSCSCLNVTELLVESRHNIWNLSHLKPQPNWPNDWAMLWILICCVDCVFHHDTYVLRVNLHSAVAWLSRISLLKACTISESYVAVTGIKPTATLQTGFSSPCSYFFPNLNIKWL